MLARSADYPDCRPRTASDYGFAGQVKAVLVKESGEGKRLKITAQLHFDRTGRLLEERRISTVDAHEGYQVFRYFYQAGSRNYEIHMFDVDPARGEKPIGLQRHLVHFDSLARCVSESDIDSDGQFNGENVYEYDDRGDLVKETSYTSDRKILHQEQRLYGSDHKLLSETAVDETGHGLDDHWSREYRYDARGNRTDMISYRQGVPEAHWIYRYDEHNRLISEQTIVTDPRKDQQVYGTCFDCGLSSGMTIYRYDAAGRKTEERMFQPGNKFVGAHSFSYDSRGNSTNSPRSVLTYDTRGNWIKQVTPGSKSAFVTQRVIEYY